MRREPTGTAQPAQSGAGDGRALYGPLWFTGLCFGLTSAYAVVRYVVFGPVPLMHTPLFVLNKSFAWTALTLLCVALALGPLAGRWPARYTAWLDCRRALGVCGVLMATGHLLLSLMILNYGYYRSYFAQAFELTALAEFTLAAGAWAFLLLLPATVVSLPGVRQATAAPVWRLTHGCLPLALLATTVHILKDAPVWWRPADWPGGLPPISLVTVVMVVATLALRVALRRATGDAP